MSEWDKLWETRGIKDWLKDTRLTQNQWLDEVKAEGDRMQRENKSLKQSVTNYRNEYVWHEERATELDQALKNMRREKVKLRQKLDAIRGLIPKLKCDRCVSWVGEPCPETCEHLIYKKISEVLGDE